MLFKSTLTEFIFFASLFLPSTRTGGGRLLKPEELPLFLFFFFLFPSQLQGAGLIFVLSLSGEFFYVTSSDIFSSIIYSELFPAPPCFSHRVPSEADGGGGCEQNVSNTWLTFANPPLNCPYWFLFEQCIQR